MKKKSKAAKSENQSEQRIEEKTSASVANEGNGKKKNQKKKRKNQIELNDKEDIPEKVKKIETEEKTEDEPKEIVSKEIT